MKRSITRGIGFQPVIRGIGFQPAIRGAGFQPVTHRKPLRHCPTARRRGVLLVAALVCLAVAMMFAATLGKVLLLQHRQAELMTNQQQSLWLAESAVQRAMHNLRASAEYTGEMWNVPADVLGRGQAGAVSIQVTKLSDSQPGWQIHVKASYPTETTKRVVCERTVSVSPSTSS